MRRCLTAARIRQSNRNIPPTMFVSCEPSPFPTAAPMRTRNCSQGFVASIPQRCARLANNVVAGSARKQKDLRDLVKSRSAGGDWTCRRWQCGRSAAAGAEKKINLNFRIDAAIDPTDLPKHPQRRAPVHALRGRCVGIDLNPSWIGLAVTENAKDPADLKDSRLLEYALVKLDLPKDSAPELVRETLAAVERPWAG